ncbi:extracellular solute-binding protein [Gleimia sp. 6138-11-ORH1]|uniref:ABC transporter substrate-binding protein n=1 Tax=Gleimia sp. 6138-11-ORH1 TaxID=2973937 RepID=UPI00216897D2|nr:extracellular solute-binding protein [Gleimia sp. 6138-11-ORH1]MCS4484710.1 extracellular solute-binding protein [Gleimia sp. 6138-11-ORH1]
MMRKLHKSMVALFAAASLALSACAGGTAPSTDSATTPEDMTLTVWTWDPAFNIYAMQEAEKVYQEKHPNFKLNIVDTPWDDLQAKLITLAQSGQTDQLPDIFLMQNYAFQKNAINYPELFSDLTDSKINFADFPKSVVDYSTVDGKNLGLPFDSGTAILALRTDVLKEAGFTVEDFTNITWKEFIAKGKVVKEKTGRPMLSSLAGQSDLTKMMIQSAGASLFNEKGEPTIADNEVLLKAALTYKELVDSGVLIEVNSWDEFISSFVNDQVTGVLQGAWISGSIQTAENQSGKWAVTSIPALDDVKDATHYSANGGSSWVVSSNAKKELATDFLKSTFGESTKFYDTILPKSGAIANYIPAGSSPVYNEPQEFYGGQAIYADIVKYGQNVPSDNTGVYYYEGLSAVSAALTKIVKGADPKEALKEAQQTVEFEMK